MQNGGFDIIVGNPPYVRIQSIDRSEANYYRKNYDAAYSSFDLYVIFFEKALRLLRPGGRLGFITSGKFLKNVYGKKLRQLLRKQATIEQIVDLSATQVFAEATTYPIIIVFRKDTEEQDIAYTAIAHQTAPGTQPPDLAAATVIPAKQDALMEGIWPPPSHDSRRMLDKLGRLSSRLGCISLRVFQGLVTSADGVYHLQERAKSSNGEVKVFSKALDRELKLEADLLKPLLSGKHIQRYKATSDDELLLFPYRVASDGADLIPSDKFANCYPLTWEYLEENRITLEGRENGKMRHEGWYGYVYPKNLTLHEYRKLAIPRLVQNLRAAYDANGKFYLDNVDAGGLILDSLVKTRFEEVPAL